MIGPVLTPLNEYVPRRGLMSNPYDYGETLRGHAQGEVVFGRYELKKIVGRGGMGVVWLGDDQQLGEEVALKFLSDSVRMDKAAMADLVRETKRSRELTHPNIIRIHDLAFDDRNAAIVMEYVAGGTLQDLRLEQSEEVMDVNYLKPVMAKVAAAMDYAHTDARIVHRDLKPANVMVDAEGRVKVADFGVARSLSDTKSRMTMVGASAGTMAYMSPQQLMGETPSAADDIYSFGAMIHELLVGRPPFHSGDLTMQVMNKEAPRINAERALIDLRPVPAEWEEMVAACLAKKIEDRPGNLDEAMGLLDGVKSGRKRKATAAKPPAKASSKRSLKLVVSAVILAGLVWGSWWVYQNDSNNKQREMEASALYVTVEKYIAERDFDEVRNGLAKISEYPGTRAYSDSHLLKKRLEELMKKEADESARRVAEKERAEEAQAERQAKFEQLQNQREAEAAELVKRANVAMRGNDLAELSKAVTQLGDYAGTKSHEQHVASLKEQLKEMDKQELLRKEALKMRQQVVEALDAEDVESATALMNQLNEPPYKDYVSTGPLNIRLSTLTINKRVEEELAARKKLEAEQPKLSERGYFSNDEVFKGTRYASYNSYAKKQVLKVYQKSFKDAGFYSSSVDGLMGKSMQEAIIEYQKAKQLQVTGILDEATINKIGLATMAEQFEPKKQAGDVAQLEKQKKILQNYQSRIEASEKRLAKALIPSGAGYLSPYAPGAGLVNTGGRGSGQVFNCPHTGRPVRVP